MLNPIFYCITYMRRNIFLWLTILTLGVSASCDDNLTQVNPNGLTASSFWKTEADAVKSVNAVYATMQNRQHNLWLLFLADCRSDEAYSESPWGDLQNVGRFTFTNYDLPWLREVWQASYQAIYRANQVIKNVPNISMDETQKKRIVAEAKAIRAYYYYYLAGLWGNVPLMTQIEVPTFKPDQASEDQVWEQVVKDLTEAKADLPVRYENERDLGRITRGGATALLGKARMQQRKWQEAADAFKEIVDQVPAVYDLMPSFKDNFTTEFENNKESLWEIQYKEDPSRSGFPNYDRAGGDETSERAQFFGVRKIGWCDGQPTRFLFNEFLKEQTVDGKVDPRLNYTIYYYTPGEKVLYGKTYEEHFGDQFANEKNSIFFKKYTNYWKATDNYFSGINTRVIRLADVYLMYAEALNELGRTAEAIPFANRVRARSSMKELSVAMGKEDFREQLRHDRIVELGGESVRWFDLRRYGILSNALAGNAEGSPGQAPLDTEFKDFRPNKSELLPIPIYETGSNVKIQQNPGW
jgi:tetratricopeptide (TPR) repeat protein